MDKKLVMILKEKTALTFFLPSPDLIHFVHYSEAFYHYQMLHQNR